MLYCFESGSLTELESHAFSLAGWPASSQNVPDSDSANTGMALPSFYVDFGDVNSGLHAHTSALAHGANYPTTHMHFKKHS